MSKGRKRKQNQEVSKEASVSQSAPTSKIKESEVVEIERLSLKDAARRYVVEFKDHHWAGIRKYADSLGLGEEATVDECLEVFKGFGCRLK